MTTNKQKGQKEKNTKESSTKHTNGMEIDNTVASEHVNTNSTQNGNNNTSHSNNNNSNNNSDQKPAEIWTPQKECWLLEAMEAYPPIGLDKHWNNLNITIKLNKQIMEYQQKAAPDTPPSLLSVETVIKKMNELYDLQNKKLDEDETWFDHLTPKSFQLPFYFSPSDAITGSPMSSTPNSPRFFDADSTSSRHSSDSEEDSMDASDVFHSSGSFSNLNDVEKLKQKTDKLDHIVDKVEKGVDQKYTSFTEFIYAALRALGGTADLQSVYDWAKENWKKVDEKSVASRFESGRSNFKSNVRSTLHNNHLFKKVEGGKWTIATNPTNAK